MNPGEAFLFGCAVGAAFCSAFVMAGSLVWMLRPTILNDLYRWATRPRSNARVINFPGPSAA